MRRTTAFTSVLLVALTSVFVFNACHHDPGIVGVDNITGVHDNPEPATNIVGIDNITGITTQTATFTYHDETYKASARILYGEHGEILDGTLLEGRDNEMLRAILSDTTLGMLVVNDTTFYLYNGEEELNAIPRVFNPCTGYWTNVKPAPSSISAGFVCKPVWKLFQDYGDVNAMTPMYASTTYGLNTAINVSVPNNDKISVVYVRGAKYAAPYDQYYRNRQSVTLYAHSNFNGNYITFYSTCCCDAAFFLKNYIAWWVWFVPVSWNDQASSFKTANSALVGECN